MFDIFNWLSGLEPGPWTLLIVVVVALSLLVAWLSYLYYQYRKEAKRLEEQRLAQRQAQEAMLKAFAEGTRTGTVEYENSRSSSDPDSEDDSPTSP